MEEEATQPATQIVMDPRRLGQNNSGLTDEDLTDIFCILHPASLPACRAVELIAQQSPEHTVTTNSAEVKFKQDVERVGTFDLAANGIVRCDIALRLSASLKDPLAGHCFGRNPTKCDFIMGHADEVKRISNVHFRIYINEHGIIMLEDQSTNGTDVDGHLLRAKDKENGKPYRHTLESGSIITLTMTPPQENFRFIVRFPPRDADEHKAFSDRLTEFFLQRKLETQGPGAKGKVLAKGQKNEPPDLFPAQRGNTSLGRVREWRGGANYNKIGVIGKGAFAVVYKITSKFDGVPYAAKELEKRRFMKNGILDQKIDSEMKIMRKINHPNIVQYIEHVDWDEHLYIIMDFVPNGDLGTLIANYGQLPELVVNSMAKQLLSALKYLHVGGITHRDVKPDNILIETHDPLLVKLTDFGLSKMVDSEETFLRTFCGTLLYCAPEVYSEYREYDSAGRRNMRGMDKKSLPPQRYGHAVDIWSLAGVLFYALCGDPPFPVRNGTTYQELLNRIMTEALDIRPLQRAGVSDNGIRFVRSMLHIRPEFRATIEELETSRWFSGEEVIMSQEDEEEDDEYSAQPRDRFVDAEQIEQGASQLSLLDESHQFEEDENYGSSDVTEIQQRQMEIPSSFNTSDGYGESYGFMQNSESANVQGYGNSNGNGNGNERLFGEVDANVSALGSSGAIPLSFLNIPNTSQINPNLVSFNTTTTVLTRSHQFDQSDVSFESKARPSIETSRQQTIPRMATDDSGAPMPPPPAPVFKHAVRDHDAEQRSERSSSLMGAESMVGHLHMKSPTPEPSPVPGRLGSPAVEVNYTTSLRRPREVEDDMSDWWPAEVPAPKRHKSKREVDIPLPASIFWDTNDKSTHHNNYPRMYNSQFNAFAEAAKAKGEQFKAGGAFFNQTMQSFRSSRSPSVEPEAAQRAASEPTKEEGRRMLMKRDDRKLGGSEAGDLHEIQSRDEQVNMPPTARASVVTLASPMDAQSDAGSFSTTTTELIQHDFLPPKRVLAKLFATEKSAVPSIVLNVVDPFMSWGRSSFNTLQYADGHQIKIPKHAFKLLLYKPGFYFDGSRLDVNGRGKPWENSRDPDQDLAFYISSKASMGIWINGIKLGVHDPKDFKSAPCFWGQLCHGDVITVWQNDIKPSDDFMKFRFECYWGKSKEPRVNQFCGLPEGPMRKEIDEICLGKQKINHDASIAEEERLRLQKEKGLKKYSLDRSIPRTTSAPGLPASGNFSYGSGAPTLDNTSHISSSKVNVIQSFSGAPKVLDETS